MSWLGAAFAWQSRAVMGRHVRLYFGDWPIKVLPPALEPITMLVAFGLGLGAYMDAIAWRGREISYLSFVAPGMIGYAAFITPVFQALFSAFVRMHFQRTWEGQLTTQIEMPHVVWGEILWASAIGTLYASIVAIVLGAMALAGILTLNLLWLPLVAPIAFVAGCGFAALGLLFTALVPTIDHMNLPIFLLILPLAFASGTYFPIDHPVLVTIATLNPLYHLAEGLRGLLLGEAFVYHLGAALALALLLVGLLVPLDMRLLRRRVLGE